MRVEADWAVRIEKDGQFGREMGEGQNMLGGRREGWEPDSLGGSSP